MSAMEKAAWTEFLVALAAVILVIALVPWLGSRATAGFAVLALVVASMYFLRQRGQRVVVGERDRQIARTATHFAVGTSWLLLVMVLAVTGMWSSYQDVHSVSTVVLNWLIWIQFALVYGLHGLAVIYLYRRQAVAT